MVLAHWLSQVIQNTCTSKPLVGISPVEMELIFSKIYPESMSGSNIKEKNLMSLVSFRKIWKLGSYVRKRIQFSEAEEAANFDYSNKDSRKIY